MALVLQFPQEGEFRYVLLPLDLHVALSSRCAASLRSHCILNDPSADALLSDLKLACD